MILGDYHTHTVFSHGKNKIEDNVASAVKVGLKEVAITDHGLRHVAFGMRPCDIFKMRKIIDKTQEETPEVKILFGVEANIYTSDGDIDLKPCQMENFDIIIAGFHKIVWPRSPKDMVNFFWRAQWSENFGYSKNTVQKFTDAYVKAIKSGNIDVITHLNYGMKTDVKQVAQAAKDYGVFIELNGKRVSMTDEEILTVQDIGAKFIVNSDAHSCGRVGEISVPTAVIERLDLNRDNIVNWDKLPEFKRSKK